MTFQHSFRARFSSALFLLLVFALLHAAPAFAADGTHTIYVPITTRADASGGTLQTDGATPEEAEVIRLTNEQRQAHGCNVPLAFSFQLTVASRLHSVDMAINNYIGHIDPSGKSPGDRAIAAGYTGVAGWENIAAGQITPADVVAAWMSSDGHRANILDCSLTEIGVGYAAVPNSTYGVYWTQNFGKR